MTTVTRPTRILREREVYERTGICRNTRRKLESQGTFPRRLPIGPRAVGWLESEVEQWIADQAASRADAQAAAVAKAKRTPTWITEIAQAAKRGELPSQVRATEAA